LNVPVTNHGRKPGVNASSFSLPKLGRALGSDPTALYRHFASKDDLVLAIADRLIEDSMAGLNPSECWVSTLVDGAEAADIYRAYGDFVLSFTGGEASFLSLDPDAQEADRMAWVGAYLTAGRADHPNIWQIRTALPDVEDDQIFETILGLVTGGLRGRAPNPCGCDQHTSERP
jgi:AcrR family transcriptional regulator